MRETKFRSWYRGKMSYEPYGDKFLCEGTPLNVCIEGMIKEGQVLMPSVNLRDKMGKEIYDGDKTKRGVVTSIIHYSVNHAAWFAGSHRLTKEYADNCEVIGNVWETPEPIRKGKAGN